ncbi:hypothetical protein [Bradyrhizobium elkanii]|uniref:hypothetical protein n=1 Tax=Bradyrhizobium elkanii TaxID=29448 RepID=UPI001BA94A2A|nr:hypothetical protein [Bradyrhizobium elkanii]MBR1164793.1 hypothetical protein [Bradyrhizobium elkanii]
MAGLPMTREEHNRLYMYPEASEPAKRRNVRGTADALCNMMATSHAIIEQGLD